VQPICPACQQQIEWRAMRFGRVFACPACAQGLHVSPLYQRTVDVIGLLFAGTIVYFMGARGYWLLFGVGVAVLPVTWCVLVTAAAIAPPALYISGYPTITLRDN
jgi:hypothetical protein